MSIPRNALLAATAAFALACSDATTTPDGPSAAIRVINATGAPLGILVDGAVAVSSVGISAVSEKTSVSAGSHVIGVRTANGTVTNITVNATANATVTTVAIPGIATGVAVSVLADTGSIVPSGKSKLRVTHLASGTSAVEFWRTQPDFQTPVHIMTPFVYGATSPYLQSDPGAWEVFVTAPGGGAKLATTGALNVPSGERRTVVLLDSLGVLKFRVLSE